MLFRTAEIHAPTASNSVLEWFSKAEMEGEALLHEKAN
jgi:hypothetical protein